MELYYSFSILIVLSAIFAYINERYLRLPSTIGVMVIALLVSLGLILTDKIFPHIFQEFSSFISSVDFSEVLMGAMLNFLLFAGAIHIRLDDLKEQKAPVIVFSTVSVIISTFAVGFMLFYILQALNMGIPLIQCLLFGALISPTDPIAVLGILKQAGVPKSLETKVAGESLFNDGIAVVVFIIMLQLARGENVDLSFGSISWLLIKEALGGVALGLLLGFAASRSIGKIDNYKIEVLITLAVVMGGHLVASSMHMSGPLAMVAAGLVVGNYGRKFALSEVSKDYLDKFWELIDEILNAILFLIIGFELIIITNIGDYWLIGLISIVMVLLARLVSIWLPVKIIPMKTKFDKATITILVWGGLRGGVSVALALSIDNNLNKELLLSVTYYVVLFSILVQGLTIGKLTNKAKQIASTTESA
ncbi:sodium:proton antiporter [Olivibacter sp. SDN3]|uniref:cation:proton antiporter n=1 Tax=Olivibacter sp. SDN3 TaxID=2764720 RepID=UPI001650E72C|nr:sodium:proton antiporter [Olivibacter sp. SDN3]QNL52151.1 sodium:proton antiporter [Olivibacter sp. SDN3]